MHVIFCDVSMFMLNSKVYDINEDEQGTFLFSGDFEQISDFIAAEYQTGKYGKVVLTGPQSEVVEQRIREYSIANYNFKDINIEIME